MNKSYAFTPRLEKYLLGMSLPAFIAALWELFTHPDWSRDESLFLRFLANIVFLNSVHVVLTFSLILGLPDLKTWVQERYGLSVKNWFLRITMFGVLLALLFLAGGAHFTVDLGWRRYFTWVLIVFGILAPHFHSLWQIQGIAALYDHNKDAAVVRERILMKVVYVTYVPVQIFFLLRSNPDSIFPIVPNLESAGRLAVFINLAAVLAVLYNSIFSVSGRNSNKTIYLARLLLYPLSGYSALAFVGISAIHGFEYLIVFWNMTDKATPPVRRSTRHLGLWMSLVFIPFLLPIYLASWFGIAPSLALQGLSAIGIAVVYLHYGIDRTLFRMRHPTTRKIVGPLLRG